MRPTHLASSLPSVLFLFRISSTITYDTLVRAGVVCTSAFVADAQRQEDSASYESNPPFAKGSRGIRILPDTYFSPQACTPVGKVHLG